MAYKIKAFPAQTDSEPIEVEASTLSFVNDDSYGKPETFGINHKGRFVLVNLAQVSVVELTVT